MAQKIVAGVSVLGGTGFIGRYLVNYMIDKGIKPIRVLTRQPNMFKNNENVSYIAGDLLSVQSLANLVSGQKLVINLAYIPEDRNSNLVGADRLLNSCVEAGVSRLIHCSTAVVTGRVETSFVDETTVCNPRTEYEKTKLAIEEKLLARSSGKIELVVVRPTAVFGDGGKNFVKIVNSLLNKSRIFNMASIMVNGHRHAHLIPVEEVVGAITYLATIEKDLSGERFFISSDDYPGNNYFNLVNHLAKIFGQKSYPKIFLPFQKVILKTILKSFGQSQIDPNQIFLNKKLNSFGYTSNINFVKAIDKFALFYSQK